jgi:hypothetical protein
MLPAAAAQAQVEEIVVTARMQTSFEGMPAVTLQKPGDFLVQEIRLINDSRSPDLRKKEILDTIQGLLRQAQGQRNIALSYGEGFLVPIDLDDESLQIIEDQKRADTSSINIFVKVALTGRGDIKKRIGELRQFIDDARVIGRTEIDPDGDIGLSIVNPERYRMELLGGIAADNARIGNAMGKGCRITVGGLENRVTWERTGIAELTLYIPYGVEVSDCAYGT